MSTQKTSKGLMGAGVLSAIAASLCCITPVLALIAGSSGLASTFSRMDPARPYLMGFTALVLGFAWYQKLKPRSQEEIDCACEEDEKPSFMQSKMFLALVTVFAVVMTAFPYYSSIFYPKANASVVVVQSSDIETVNLNISGMTCTSCEEHVKHSVSQLNGIVETEASWEEGTATVKFDKTKTTVSEVVAAVNETGYTVIDNKN